MTNYLVEHSAGGILRQTFAIYRKHFITLMLVFAIATLPFISLSILAATNERPGLSLLFLLAAEAGLFVGLAAMTVAVSDVCVGNRPSVARSFRRALGRTSGRLLKTSLLQTLFLIVGALLLFVGFFVFTVWFLFAMPVVVLEARSGWDALKRSKSLGNGYHWRNAGVYLMLSLVVGVLSAIIIGVVVVVTRDPAGWPVAIAQLVSLVGLIFPVLYIAIILTYYDLRVRKEGFDMQALSEELAR